MAAKNNPAGRLHVILSEAINCGNVPTFLMWAKVLNAQENDKTETLRRIFQLHELVDEIKLKISGIDGINSDLYLSRFPNIENVVKATNYDVSWESYKPQLNEAAMLNLEHCAEALSRYDEQTINEDDLAKLDAEILELFNKVVKGSIPQALKEIILDLLETIRRSIAEYRIRGAHGIREELAYCFGKAFQNRDLFKDNKDSEEVTSWWEIFARADNLTTISLNLLSVSTTAMNLLALYNK